ncbi:MBL fold metallo-hydrolase [Altibacter sp.]|uniref:MBL fold metallo-hydrolase n=1 Tax=Altibacter sp. TaxID=2024823 RepID=UPI000C93272E|nr:MBL fold metallo-hydrolase [Altibacter sp.]MAP53933.1 MBL fold metallo-hydrolase [Altibacter sp.]
MRHSILLFCLIFSIVLSANAQKKTSELTDDEKEKAAAVKAENDGLKLTKLSENIYMLEGKGGNIGLSVGEDGVFMIDDQFADASPIILNRIRSLSSKPIQFLINTHHHGDHTGGNSNFKQEGAAIISHENARKRLLESGMEQAQKKYDAAYEKALTKASSDGGNNERAKEMAKKSVGEVQDYLEIDQQKLPVVTFDDDLTFHYNGEKIMVFHVHEAHTDGDALVYFTESNVLHTGDVFFNGKYPYIDVAHGGDVYGALKALNEIKMLINEDTKIIPGHGPVATLRDLNESIGMLRYLTEQYAYHFMSKKSKDQILKLNLTKEYDAEGYGDGYIKTAQFHDMLFAETQDKYGIPKEKLEAQDNDN